MTPDDMPEGMVLGRAILAMDERVLDLDLIDEGSQIEVADEPALGTAEALDLVHEFISDYVVLPGPAAYDAVTLWVLHTWAFGAAECTPRLFITAAVKASGKSRVGAVLEEVCRNAKKVTQPTAAYVKRYLEGRTLLLDEIDTIWTGKGEDNAMLKGILNEGYTQGGTVGVVESDGNGRFATVDIPVFAPVALIGIDDDAIPDTLRSRSIVIRMDKKLPSEVTKPFRRRPVSARSDALKQDLRVWAKSTVDALVIDSDEQAPVMPSGMEDRAYDIWEPLVKIAEHAGGTWAERGVQACAALGVVPDAPDDSLVVRLVRDVLAAFARAGNPPFMPTADLYKAVVRPGSEWERCDYNRAMTRNKFGRHMTAIKAPSAKPYCPERGKGVNAYLLAPVQDWWKRNGPQDDDDFDARPMDWNELINISQQQLRESL